MSETNAERIEHLKYSGSFTMTNQNGPGPLVSSIQKSEFDWLIKQAEWAQELEAYCEKSANFINQIDLEIENKRLREALEAIATETGTPYSDIARQALEPSS